MVVQPKNIEINEQFRKTLDLLETTSKNAMVTGRAGTGKSTLLNLFVKDTHKDVVILAPTGVAAVNIGGLTIHSFFGFKPGITPSKVKNVYRDVYKVIDMIIIDEISMVRADLLDCVDKFMRLNGKHKNRPFGGVQIVFIGDLYQLPPVVKGDERGIFETHYKSPYFFDANVFKNLDIEFIELEKVYRQVDEKFIDLLNAIRNKSVTPSDLQEINKRVNPNFIAKPNEFYINLTTTNNLSDEINNRELCKLTSKLFIFNGKIRGNFDRSYLPTEEMLNVKTGSQVMMLNNDSSGRWMNGTIGEITGIKESDSEKTTIKVKLETGNIVDVSKHKWDLTQITYNAESKGLESSIIGSFTQYPLRLAWAITIHKGQGKTFERVVIDIGRGTFVHGQMYVALSRCTSLQGLVLKKPVEKKHILLDWRVVKFLTQFQYNISEHILSLDEKVELIKKAISSKSNLKITYLKSNDQKSKRVIAPEKVGEMEFMGKSYIGVEGYCFKREENRVFRVDRILEMKEAGQHP